MKVYCFIWLALGMTYYFAEWYVISNPGDKDKFFGQFMFVLIPMSYFACDVLLFISAFINTYNFMKADLTVSFVLK